jgi:hypothetical protein
MKFDSGIAFPDARGSDRTTAIGDGVNTKPEFKFRITVKLTVFQLDSVVKHQLNRIIAGAVTIAVLILTSGKKQTGEEKNG